MRPPHVTQLTVAFAFVLVARAIGQQTPTPEPPATALPQNGTEPAWSPDGTRLAFGVAEGTRRSLWTMTSDGRDARCIVPAAEGQHYPRWSPDGARITYVRRAADVVSFQSIRPDGSDARSFLPESAPRPELAPIAWASDGRRVAYTSKSAAGESRVVVVDVENGTLLGAIAGPSHSPCFAPDGTRLLYLAEDQVWLADGNGQHGRAILTAPAPMFPTDPTWSRDGTGVLFAAMGAEHSELWTARSDGSALALLFRAPLRFFYPSWSPAGDRIVMAVRQTDSWDLWLQTIDAKGANPRRLAGECLGAPLFLQLGDYRVAGRAWAAQDSEPKPLEGTSRWTRALGGPVVRETVTIDTGRRPVVGEVSITRTAVNAWLAVWIDEASGEQRTFHGTWDTGQRTLTFERSGGGTEPKDAERWVYHFAAEGLVRKETFARSADGSWSRRTELAYSPTRG